MTTLTPAWTLRAIVQRCVSLLLNRLSSLVCAHWGVLSWTPFVGPGQPVMRLSRCFGPPFSGVLNWGQIGKSAVWSVVVVVVAVFFEHEMDFPHRIKHFMGQ